MLGTPVVVDVVVSGIVLNVLVADSVDCSVSGVAAVVNSVESVVVSVEVDEIQFVSKAVGAICVVEVNIVVSIAEVIAVVDVGSTVVAVDETVAAFDDNVVAEDELVCPTVVAVQLVATVAITHKAFIALLCYRMLIVQQA